MSVHSFLISALWTGITIACYLIGLGCKRISRNNALANPALITIVLVSVLLITTHTPYTTYFRATWVLTFLLGPATVALGIPLAKNFTHIRQSLLGVGVGLVAGSVVSMVSGALLVRLFHGSNELAVSLMPKAVTTPIAMSVAEEIGGVPALTATLAIVGGILTAITVKATLTFFRVEHEHAVGLAAGTAGSGIAASHVAAMGDGPAAFAAIGIGLNGLVTALLAPMLASWL